MIFGVLRSGAIYGLANVLAAGVPFLLLPILTRALTPAQYGEVISFYMLVAVSGSVAGLSLQAAVGVRWLDTARGDPGRYTASAMLLVVLSTALAALLASALAPLAGVELSVAICSLAAVMAGSNVLQGIRFAVWQSCERPLQAATLQVSSAVLNIALSLLAVLALQMGGRGRILGATIAIVMVALVGAWLLIRERSATRPSFVDLRALLRFGLPLTPHTLAGALLVNADRFAVSTQLGSGALGIYGTAAQLGMVINVIADAAIKAYSPSMYRLLSRNTARSRLRVVAITYLSIPVWLLVAGVLWAAFFLLGRWLLGDRYLDAIELSVWFLLGGALTGVYLNIAGLFFFTGKTEWVSVATVSASVVAMLLAPYAVSSSALIGGGVAYLCAQFAMLTAAWVLSRQIQPMPWGHPVLALRVLMRQPPAVQ
jgi:O-antigen/teichoic acid export membrane protein